MFLVSPSRGFASRSPKARTDGFVAQSPGKNSQGSDDATPVNANLTDTAAWFVPEVCLGSVDFRPAARKIQVLEMPCTGWIKLNQRNIIFSVPSLASRPQICALLTCPAQGCLTQQKDAMLQAKGRDAASWKISARLDAGQGWRLFAAFPPFGLQLMNPPSLNTVPFHCVPPDTTSKGTMQGMCCDATRPKLSFMSVTLHCGHIAGIPSVSPSLWGSGSALRSDFVKPETAQFGNRQSRHSIRVWGGLDIGQPCVKHGEVAAAGQQGRQERWR